MALPAVGSVQGRGSRSVVWADVAKGVCILLVVLHHLVGKHYVNVLPDRLDGLAATWNALTYKLKPVRLPLFFLISGFFAANAVRRPWREVWPTRVGNLYYLYALWLCIHTVLFAQLTQLPMNRTQSAADLAGDLLVASTGVWYLYALIAYFVAVRPAIPLAHLGQRTLPIYVLHVPVLAVVHIVVISQVSVTESWLLLPAVAVYPIVLALAVVVACLILKWALEAIGAGALLNGPLSRPHPTQPAAAATSGRSRRPGASAAVSPVVQSRLPPTRTGCPQATEAASWSDRSR